MPRRGFSRWRGASGPDGVHHSSASAAKRATSAASSVPFSVIPPLPNPHRLCLPPCTAAELVRQHLIVDSAGEHHAADHHGGERQPALAWGSLAGAEIGGKCV